MSEFVANYPVIAALLRRYRAHNIEYAAVAPFQTTFCTLFTAREGYAVNMEQSVDRDRQRVDLFIQGLDSDHGTLYPILVGEMKGGGRGPREVETQVLARAREAIHGNDLEEIYAFTSLGEGFRFWSVTARDLTLVPLSNADIPRGSRSAYILLDSPGGDCIVTWSDYIKSNRPIRLAPAVPSQAIPANFYQTYEAQGPSIQHEQDDTDTRHSPSLAIFNQAYTDSGTLPSQVIDNPADSYQTNVAPGSSTQHEQAGTGTAFSPPAHADFGTIPVPEPEAGPSDRRHGHRRDKKVTIQKRRLIDGYKFDFKGRVVETTPNEWTQDGGIWRLKEKFHGHSIWGYEP